MPSLYSFLKLGSRILNQRLLKTLITLKIKMFNFSCGSLLLITKRSIQRRGELEMKRWGKFFAISLESSFFERLKFIGQNLSIYCIFYSKV